ncbi:hypothetical protein DFJ73DRAFT_848841, partial [Zopfochytrium polystomum]
MGWFWLRRSTPRHFRLIVVPSFPLFASPFNDFSFFFFRCATLTARNDHFLFFFLAGACIMLGNRS